MIHLLKQNSEWFNFHLSMFFVLKTILFQLRNWIGQSTVFLVVSISSHTHEHFSQSWLVRLRSFSSVLVTTLLTTGTLSDLFYWKKMCNYSIPCRSILNLSLTLVLDQVVKTYLINEQRTWRLSVRSPDRTYPNLGCGGRQEHLVREYVNCLCSVTSSLVSTCSTLKHVCQFIFVFVSFVLFLFV